MSEACRALRRAGDLGQRLVLQRDRGPFDLSDADHRHGRRDPHARRTCPRPASVRAGDRIVLLGRRPPQSSAARPTCACSTASSRGARRRSTSTPRRGSADLLRALVFEGRLRTAHDLSEGGLAVAMAEACFARGLGADIRRAALAGGPVLGDPGPRAASPARRRPRMSVLRSGRGRREFRRESVGEVGGTRLRIARRRRHAGRRRRRSCAAPGRRRCRSALGL